MKRCVLYGRVSTKAEKGRQDPEVQLWQLRKFAKTQGWKITAEFIDRESGANNDRKRFNQMLEAASRREFDVLLFWSIDRFSRSGIVHVLTTLNRVSDYGIKYRSFQEPYIDTTSPFGDLLVAFAAKMAELERNRIRERVRAGLERARENGVRLGRPQKVFNRTRVLELQQAGWSLRKIAGAAGISPMTVHRVLRSE